MLLLVKQPSKEVTLYRSACGLVEVFCFQQKSIYFFDLEGTMIEARYYEDATKDSICLLES